MPFNLKHKYTPNNYGDQQGGMSQGDPSGQQGGRGSIGPSGLPFMPFDNQGFQTGGGPGPLVGMQRPIDEGQQPRIPNYFQATAGIGIPQGMQSPMQPPRPMDFNADNSGMNAEQPVGNMPQSPALPYMPQGNQNMPDSLNMPGNQNLGAPNSGVNPGQDQVGPFTKPMVSNNFTKLARGRM